MTDDPKSGGSRASASRTGYRFFDATFTLETDSAAFAAGFDRAYGAFKSAEPVAGPVYRVTLGSPGESSAPEVTIAGEAWRSTNREAIGIFAYNAILNAVTARVRSHYLFHAAGLAAPAGGTQAGVILAGGSGLGKTTLTLALAAQGAPGAPGYRAYSDDVAAVGRDDGQLYPFPRRLGVREPNGAPGEKRLLDIDEIAPYGSQQTASCPARFLFVLTGPAAGSAWYLLPERVDDGLLASLRGVAGVLDLQVLRGEPHPVLRAVLAAGAWPGVEPAIQAACRRHDVLLFEITRGPEGPPDFEAAPELAPLAPSEAAQALVGHLKGGPRSALLSDEFGGSAARLYLALAGTAAGMACYRLRVGRLDEMVRLIRGAVAGSAEA